MTNCDMNTFNKLTLMGLVWGMGMAAAGAGAPDKLTLNDLVNHPERWPEMVTVTREFKLRNGTVVHQGDKVRLVEFNGTQVGVGAGSSLFRIRPEDCGLLEAANQAWSALTPAQRAVDPDSLAGDVSLWPARVKVVSAINCNFGTLAPGTEVGLLKFTKQGAEVAWPNSNNRLEVNLDSTDVLSRARKLALVDADKRESRIALALHGLLVDADGKPYDDKQLAEKKYFALYFGANWCAPCHAFSPTLVKFLDVALPKHPELAAVMMSNDEQPAQMLTYMKEAKMPFPAVPLKDLNRSPLLLSYAAKMIPHMVVVDRFGKVLATNDDEQGNRSDPEDTVKALGRLLAAQK